LLIALRFSIHFGLNTYELLEDEYEYQTVDGKSFEGSKQKFFTDWLVEVENLITSLRSKNAYMIITGPVPEWEDFQVRCNLQWFQIPSSECLTTKNAQERFHRKAISRLNKLSQQHLNFQVVDMFRQICKGNTCGIADHKGVNYIGMMTN